MMAAAGRAAGADFADGVSPEARLEALEASRDRWESVLQRAAEGRTTVVVDGAGVPVAAVVPASMIPKAEPPPTVSSAVARQLVSPEAWEAVPWGYRYRVGRLVKAGSTHSAAMREWHRGASNQVISFTYLEHAEARAGRLNVEEARRGG